MSVAAASGSHSITTPMAPATIPGSGRITPSGDGDLYSTDSQDRESNTSIEPVLAVDFPAAPPSDSRNSPSAPASIPPTL